MSKKKKLTVNYSSLLSVDCECFYLRDILQQLECRCFFIVLKSVFLIFE